MAQAGWLELLRLRQRRPAKRLPLLSRLVKKPGTTVALKALVCFSGRSDHPLAWLLHKEFRHVFVAVQVEECWVRIDGADGRVRVEIAANAGYDLAALYRDHGFTVIETEQGPGWVGPFVPANCVGLVRSVLGLRAPFVFTPYQLYKRLSR